jgi:hypothetical protein
VIAGEGAGRAVIVYNSSWQLSKQTLFLLGAEIVGFWGRGSIVRVTGVPTLWHCVPVRNLSVT